MFPPPWETLRYPFRGRLDETIRLVCGLTIEGIAARAGVGKQTIYRWWPSKGAVLLDVLVEQITGRLAAADTGSPLDDLRRRVRVTAEVLADNAIGPHVAGLLGDAQGDAALANELHERLVAPARAQHRELIHAAQEQGELRADIDVDLMADALFAPIWFRLLVTRAELSAEFADDIAGIVIPAWTGGQSRVRHRWSLPAPAAT